ncbi:MAG: TetR/AcrR family transcriptional regulator, partial [Actinomycetota bacterium]
MARPPDLARRSEILDGAVAYLAEHGLADVSLRPMARAIGLSPNGLVHHFGTKEQLLVEALERVNDVQSAVLARWLRREPDLTLTALLRKWWRWTLRSPANLALVRLGIEAAALEATET